MNEKNWGKLKLMTSIALICGYAMGAIVSLLCLILFVITHKIYFLLMGIGFFVSMIFWVALTAIRNYVLAEINEKVDIIDTKVKEIYDQTKV